MFQARDLLFARLLAYRAYQQVAALFAELEAGALRRYPARGDAGIALPRAAAGDPRSA